VPSDCDAIRVSLSLIALAATISCSSTPSRPTDPAELITLGETIFFEETFDGNGRTCGTCHRREDNFGLSPAFIATLPADDPLFVAERQRALAQNFEKPAEMREHGLILENQDGFDDLDNNFNLRGVPHVLSLATSVASADGPRTGWSGDGAPGDGSLRAFAAGAVIQHFPKRLDRVAGVDFRLPTDVELDAIEAFMLTLGRQQDLRLPIPLQDGNASLGQRVFLANNRGKCNACHLNAGANVDELLFGPGAGNQNFNTGVLPNPGSPIDDGFGNPGTGEFNTPTLVEAADTAPFFHNNSAPTLEAAVAFYNTVAFNNSPAGRTLAERTGGPIALDGNEILAVTAFLRVLNALENIRVSVALLEESQDLARRGGREWQKHARQARFETEDAIEVLQLSNLHPEAVGFLQRARASIDDGLDSRRRRTIERSLLQAMSAQRQARAELLQGGGT